ncbi:MAG: formyl-CoA transferase [Chloroflexi bacterium]|nr:formyl-CoA transferase [Chloroflexota bacterium]
MRVLVADPRVGIATVPEEVAMGAALEGMRILDMTQYEAGTSATQALAWLGADVVKIESPSGDPGRLSFTRGTPDSQYFLNYNSNKRSVVLDLKTARGRELFLALVPRFDVFIENYGPGVIESLDIGYERLSALNPRLLYCRIKGFGLDGPYAPYKCFDGLAQAMAGAFSVTGEPDGPPTKPGPTVADTGTGMQAALAIAAAWAQRQRTGRGQHIEISMQEAMSMFMRTVGVADWAQHPAMRRSHRAGVPSGIYPCAPGGPNDYIYMLIGTTRMWDQLCSAMGRDDLLVDPRFQTAAARREHADVLDEEIAQWSRQRDKHEAMRVLAETGVAASAVFDTMDVFHDPHLHARGFVQQVEHPTEGTVTLLGSPFRMSDSHVELRPAPVLGADTEAVLRAELGIDDRELSALREAGAIGARRRDRASSAAG